MEQSSSILMSAKISFVNAQLSLIRIPLSQYQKYLPIILKLLFPSSADEVVDPGISSLPGSSQEGTTWANQHAFFNVSITPIECSVICPQNLAEQYFASKIAGRENKAKNGSKLASMSSESYLVISIEGEGTEAGQRVLELTGPLALAGIPLFFITTYFSDYILVPAKSKTQVIHALETRGFAFEESSDSYINPSAHHHRHTSSSSSFGTSGSPSTRPPTTISELQARTFALLNQRSIVPRVDDDIRLVQCAGRQGDDQESNRDEVGLQLGLTKSLLHQPSFLSLTLTATEAASMLLEKRLLFNFSIGTDSVLLGSTDNDLIPITLDLEPLPFEATGIVCGVAGRLVGGHSIVEPIEMSYLSTAKAGTVMVNEKDLESAMRALRVGEDGAIEP